MLQLIFFTEENGKSPVTELMDGFHSEVSEKLKVALKKLHMSWGSKVCNAKKLDQGLFELRVSHNKLKYRLLFKTSGNLLLILHLLVKKRWQISQKDKKVALDRFRRYLQLNGQIIGTPFGA